MKKMRYRTMIQFQEQQVQLMLLVMTMIYQKQMDNVLTGLLKATRYTTITNHKIESSVKKFMFNFT
eukprot:m.61251 g.61251  ORF g.61251 m.61251 type:complete len:66 (+) comp11390_c0_seq1:695-892(+)